MKLLIIYATNEGQTRKIARFMEEALQLKNYKVVLADATDEPPKPTGFDLVIVGGSLHMHKYQSSIHSYIMQNRDELNRKISAFFSVCLAVASDIEEEHDEAHNIAEIFLDKTGWKPNEIWHYAGALKYTKYDYFKRLVMRMIAKKQGDDTDTSKDYEYTDWEAVKSSALKFVANAEKLEQIDG